MSPYDQLMQRIANGDCILIDGGTGTEVERRGVPHLENAWNSGGTLSHPDIVRAIHEDYLGSGAEIIISNTFGTHWHALRDAGVESHFEEYTRRAIELTLEARENSGKSGALVAGGISYWTWTDDFPALDVVESNAARQARIMADAGADLIMLEMMVDIERMIPTLDGALSAGLPVWAGLTCEPDENGDMRLRNGDALEDAVTVLKERKIPLISIMHTEVKFIDGCLAKLRNLWDQPVGVYAHTGGNANGKWTFDDMISPENYAAASARWIDSGVQVIGGCCGIRDSHIAAVGRIIKDRNA